MAGLATIGPFTALRVCMDQLLFGTLTLAKAGLSYQAFLVDSADMSEHFFCVRRTGG